MHTQFKTRLAKTIPYLYIKTEMAKIDSMFMTEKPYPHTYIAHVSEYPPPGGLYHPVFPIPSTSMRTPLEKCRDVRLRNNMTTMLQCYQEN